MSLSAHAKAQAVRFLRLFVVAFFASGVLLKSGLGMDAIVSAVVGAVEVAWRQMNPVVPAEPAPPAPPA